MKKSTKIRLIIFEILIEVFKKNKSFDELFEIKINQHNIDYQEKSFIFNVCLNTMRRSIHTKIILEKFVKKKLKITQYILLSSAVTQLLYLNIKPYAVVNETVEIAKKIGLYSSFVNSVLKNIVSEIEVLRKRTIIKKGDLPVWLQVELKKNKDINLNMFLNTYFLEPDLHIVFKSSNYLSFFKEDYEISTKKSVFVNTQKKVSELSNYEKGYWWVQNFSSMLPLVLGVNLKDKKVLDLCAAPGGKAFQILSNNENIILNDVNKKRIKILKENLLRLNYSATITNYDALEFPDDMKYDAVILDAPCSAIGTVMSNPEIMFRNNSPNLKILSELQNKLLNKASTLIHSKGVITYMVCSFFFSETIKPVKEFLRQNKNFSILKYIAQHEELNKFISKEGYFLTPPNLYKNHKISGFFSIQLIKND